MTIEVSTTEFEFSHGRKPRGHGHWIFDAVCNGRQESVAVTGKYAEAKKRAMWQFKQRAGSGPVWDVKVGP